MPKCTCVELPAEEQAQMLTALRRARYGYLLALHILRLCAAGRNPTEIAAVLLCSRSSVYRTVRAYQEGTLGLEYDDQGRLGVEAGQAGGQRRRSSPRRALGSHPLSLRAAQAV